MAKKSNIMPVSNVFILKGEIRGDKKFRAQIRGRENLRKMKEINPYNVVFTPAQEKEWELGMYCTEQKDRGDQVRGIVLENGKYNVQCRCYEYKCPLYKECRPGFNSEKGNKVIVRPADWKFVRAADVLSPSGPTVKPDFENIESVLPGTQGLKPKDVINIIFDDDIISELPPPVLDIDENTYGTNFEKQGQEAIIEGDSQGQMLVLAGPGTGKTYCLIEKLKYMVEKERVLEADSILLLCFTRSAVKEIKERFSAVIEAGDYSDDLSRLEIRTFDSFATRVLIARDVDTTGKDYDQRIQMAIDEIKSEPSILQEMQHFIVDEIQDLVGVRARLVQAILECRPDSCGFTLLGDHLQGIYDHQVKNIPGEPGASGLLDWLRKKFANSLNTIGLDENHRQSGNLANYSIRSRKLLVSNNIDNTMHFIESLKRIVSCGKEYDFEPPGEKEDRVAILCRNNGEVLKLSGNLRSRGIDHTLRRKNNFPLLPVWVADLLGTTGGSISLQQLEQVNGDSIHWPSDQNEHIYSALESLNPVKRGVVKVSDLKNTLASGGRLPEELYERHSNRVCMSTIHQSKGREYECVLLLRPGNHMQEDEIFEEAKVYYVAITRAKKSLFCIERSKSSNYLTKKYSNSGRWAELIPKGNKKVLVAVEVGMEHDIDEQSFVNNKIHVDPAHNQHYIREKVKPGDPVELILNNSDAHYDIIHNNKVLGRMSDKFFFDITRGMREVCWKPPGSFEEIYIDRVYSVIKKPETISPDVGEPWVNSGVWYAVSVSGMGLVRWDGVY